MNLTTFALFPVLVTLLIASAMLGCRPREASLGRRSEVDALAAVTSGEVVNQLVMFGAPGGEGDFLPAVKLDLEMLPPLFRHPKIGFEAKPFYDKTYDEIIATTEKAAHDVGKDGTLIWIFSGHGMSAGELIIHQDILKFPKVAKAIKKGRENRPLRRLIVMVDACYSGNLIDGFTPVTNYDLYGSLPTYEQKLAAANEVMAQAILDSFGVAVGQDGSGFNLSGTLFEELIVLTSARSSEISNSDADKGSQMVRALSDALGVVTQGDGSPTLDEFFDAVLKGTEKLNVGRQSPQVPLYLRVPEGIGTQKVIVEPKDRKPVPEP